MAPRIDILTQHAEEAAFLYARLRRSHRVLDGNARQTRSLLARIDAHLDALTLFARDARGAVKGPAEVREVGERFVAACLAAVTGGVASGCNRGAATFLLYSFDVSFDGEGVCRLGDPLFHNGKNTLG